MTVLARLDQARSETDVLEHPFYRRWSAGGLTRPELACYAGQYRHAVVALAEASGAAAGEAAGGLAQGLRAHAEEEFDHVALWDRFAAGCGVAEPAQEAAFESTRGCVQSWTAGSDLLERLAVLYVLEASQPQISLTKLEGLRAHYDHVEEGPATDYFTVHATRDVEHAAAAGELIGQLMADAPEPEQQADRMVARAEAALRGNWLLLDGVEAAA